MTNIEDYKAEAKTLMNNCFANYANELKPSFSDDAELTYTNSIEDADSPDQLHRVVKAFADEIVYPFPPQCTSDFAGLAQDLSNTLETN